jgi:hypothetical protein
MIKVGVGLHVWSACRHRHFGLDLAPLTAGEISKNNMSLASEGSASYGQHAYGMAPAA